jgi:predicted nucleic acid-binding protein
MIFFLDTSFLYALEDASDLHHEDSLVIWKTILKNHPRFILTSYIFDETATLLQSKLGYDKAYDVGSRLLQSNLVELVHVTPDIFQDAWAYFCKNKDKGYSFTDCVSFAVMGRLNIKNALTFDRHFRQAGFKVFVP